MGLTPEKEQLRLRINEANRVEHEAATAKAARMGRPLPPPPVVLEAHHIEFPKWLHKDWKAEKGKTHLVPGDAELALNAEHMKELIAKGFSDEAPKSSRSEAKKEEKPVAKKE